VTTFTPGSPTEPAPPPASPQPPGGNVVARTVGRLRAASQSTPGRFRLWSLAAVAVLVLAAVAATASAAQMRGATNRVRTNSGPVLVATQQLVSSLAEADAAQTAAFLSGRDEDPEQRRIYEQALARAEQQMEQIAARVGDDPAVHDLLQRVSVRVSTYAGLVEAARASNRAGVPEAPGYLVESVSLGNAIVQDDLTALTAATQERLGRDEDRRSQGWIIALAVVVCGLAVLGFGQAQVAKASRRIVNLPLAVGTLALLAVLVWLVVAQQGSGNAIRDARRQGYDSIALTAQLQTAGFGSKANETLALVTGDPNPRAEADSRASVVATEPVTAEVADGIRSGTSGGAPGGLLGQAAANSATPRSRAAVAEVAQRWQRYRDTVAALRSAPSADDARAVAVGRSNAEFNGFNFSVEAVLGQSRGQFLAGLETAADRTARVPNAALLLVLGALVAALWGFQLRINDYR
jgi:CHASE3 domain sensor protein